MRINEQRDELAKLVRDLDVALQGMRVDVSRKLECPDGNGERSNLINASSDVLPRLQSMLGRINEFADLVGPDQAERLGLGDSRTLASQREETGQCASCERRVPRAELRGDYAADHVATAAFPVLWVCNSCRPNRD